MQARALYEAAAMACLAAEAETVNDIHARLNPTRVHRIERPQTTAEVVVAVRRAALEGRPVAISGGRHAMGGQQFATDAVQLDMSALDRVIDFDSVAGEVEAEAGIQWPALVEWLHAAQENAAHQWGIAQKQTGADRLSLGGALAANIHGRGLQLKPIVEQVAAFTIVDPAGNLRRCSRAENADLFRLAIGGYGLFGPITSVRLKLVPRRKVERVVERRTIDGLMAAFAQRIAAGYLYGDFQFSIDDRGDDFLREGIFSCYRPVDDDAPIPDGQHGLTGDDWMNLLHLAHVDKRRAVDAFTAHYLSTSGFLYWSDSHQLAPYLDDYHEELDQRLGATCPATEVISEFYVPRERLTAFMEAARADLLAHQENVIYGTVRLIEQDDESFLAWARQPWACVIFNLHTEHTPAGVERTNAAFRRLADLAISFGGSFYLTYGRFAERRQLETCHPRLVEFQRAKRAYDPAGRYQSEWYRHHASMFGESI
jgi:FAD/FMN-containing dehydrogenase